MYEKCLTCSKLGESCDGPNFMAMPTSEIVEWIDQYQHLHGITNTALAAKSNIAKGTIDGIKARKRSDIRHETLRPILKALIGEVKLDCDFGETENELNTQIAELKAENKRLLHELHMAEKMDGIQERSISQLESIVKSRMIVIYGLTALCVFLIFNIINYIRLDISNPGIGLFGHSNVSPWFFISTGVSILMSCIVIVVMVRSSKKNKIIKEEDVLQ